MRIILPPSETKAPGGGGGRLRIDSLSFPELAGMRERLVDELVRLSAQPPIAMDVLGIGAKLHVEVERNARLRDANTAPAIERYTGVLFDALDIAGLTPAQRRRADGRLLVGSALFGLVGAADMIPHYRLSAGTRLPAIGPLAAVWRPVLGPVIDSIAEGEPLIDLRSEAYRQLAPCDAAITVRVLSVQADGSLKVVSHANKSTKGAVARVLATTTAAVRSGGDVARVLSRAGFSVRAGDGSCIEVLVGAGQ